MIALESGFPFVKLISPEHFIGYSVSDSQLYLLNTSLGSRKSERN
jgi:hypothetical protein